MKWWLEKQLLRIKLYCAENYQKESESLIIWYAVCYALGIAFYFAIPWELPIWLLIIYFEIALILLYLSHQKQGYFKLITYLTVFILGLCIAKADALYRSTNLEEKTDEISYLNGYIEQIDKFDNSNTRIILNNVNNFDKELKGKYRISIRKAPAWLKDDICIELVAQIPNKYTINPLNTYDFKRALFYQGINAVGYPISPIFQKDCEQHPHKIKNKVNLIRQKIAQIIETNTSKREASIIKALTIGDKTSIDETTADNYRTSGLAHLLAISGMHMGMIALVIFFLIRILLLPIGNGRYDLRKPAAVFTLILTFAYFVISGQSISCIRAFIMMAIILLAILFNRRAITLRLWAFALIIIATLSPIAVVSPGFLMSFSATLGITAFYEQNREKINQYYYKRTIKNKILIYFLGILITDLIASLMTLPFSIYFFHQFSLYTTLANLLAAPIIAFWIMPAVLLFLLSLPFRLYAYPLYLLETGIKLINTIADWVSSLAGAKMGLGVALMPTDSILLITLGLLWLCIWQQKWRYLGILSIIIGLINYKLIPNADFVFDSKATTMACRTDDNRLTLSPWQKNKYLARIWGKKADIKKETTGLKCDNKKCFCQNKIEFSKGNIKYNDKTIALKEGGYINLKKGVFYNHATPPRIWNK